MPIPLPLPFAPVFVARLRHAQVGTATVALSDLRVNATLSKDVQLSIGSYLQAVLHISLSYRLLAAPHMFKRAPG